MNELRLTQIASRASIPASHSSALGAVLLTATLAACGGGGADGPAAPLAAQPPASFDTQAPAGCLSPPEGLAQRLALVAGGTITGRPDPSFILVAPSVTAPRTLFYGPDLQSTSRITGFIRAEGSVFCSIFDLRPYNSLDYPSGAAAYLNATPLSTAPNVSGTIRTASNTAQFSGGSIPGSSYVFNAAPRLADAVGAWTLHDLNGDSFRIEIKADGALTGEIRRAQIMTNFTKSIPDENCKLSGTLKADPQSPLNLLRLAISSSCISFSGLGGYALVMPLHSGGTQLLLWTEFEDFGYSERVLGIGRR